MAIKLMDTIETAGDFPLIQATDVGMADGSRLAAYLEDHESAIQETAGTVIGAVNAVGNRVIAVEKQLDELSISYPVEEAKTDLLPERYYEFGEVDHLEVNLVEMDDGKAHEYYFEFIPTEDFTELTVTPTPKWAREPQYPAGKTCQVSILRGIGVMVNA